MTCEQFAGFKVYAFQGSIFSLITVIVRILSAFHEGR